MSKTKYQSYVENMQKYADVEYSIAVLSWDKEVNLPTKGAPARSRQVATLSGIAHEIFTNKEFGATLQSLANDSKDLNPREKRNIQLTQKDFNRINKFDTDFVMRRSQLISTAFHAWLKARESNDFSVYEKPLADLVDLKIEEAEIVGYKDHPYNALMEEFEPGATVEELDILFKDVRNQLVNFAAKIRSKSEVDNSFLRKNYPKDKQWDFGIEILKNIGYDFEAGRQDISTHPFTTNFSASDVRVTTRIDENDLGNMTWSCIHEGGHALYEQGLPVSDYGLPTGKYVSLGIHESQSRLWENNVGRSLPFWKAHYPRLQAAFPENLSDVSLSSFYHGINKIAPNLIRTEADELHYHFHVLIRYEIEKGLIEKSIKVGDLPEVWNAKYKEYLGVEVPNDKKGVLQDIHWSHGSIGYFPTYSLGSFYAAQFFAQAKKEIPDLIDQIEQGNNLNLLSWLREKIHQHGRFYDANELCEKVTGEKLNFKYFMDYVNEKYGDIYNL